MLVDSGQIYAVRREGGIIECLRRQDKFYKEENIIPFALSQGGAYSKHNLYAEVLSAMREGGYIHAGLKQMLQAIREVDKKQKLKVSQQLDEFFTSLSFCGPRIVNSPGRTEDAAKLCQLFVPYKHAMQRFYTAMRSLFDKNIRRNKRAYLLPTMANLQKKTNQKYPPPRQRGKRIEGENSLTKQRCLCRYEMGAGRAEAEETCVLQRLQSSGLGK